MNEGIAVALIAGAATIISNIITSRKTSREMSSKMEANQREMMHKLETQQAITDTKMEELTREVRAHNNFAQRMPVVENRLDNLQNTVGALQKYHMV